jgi:hypothetical protein
MQGPRGPQPLSSAIAQVVAMRGLAQEGSRTQLATAWRDVAKQVAGEAIVRSTRVINLNRGVLVIAVASAPVLGELVSFHKSALLKALKEHHGDLKIRDLKFKQQGDLKTR